LLEKAFFAHYIVRIYRFNKNKPGRLVGVVEEVGTRFKKAFTNYDELWDILVASKSTIQKRKSPSCEGKTKRKGGDKGTGMDELTGHQSEILKPKL